IGNGCERTRQAVRGLIRNLAMGRIIAGESERAVAARQQEPDERDDVRARQGVVAIDVGRTELRRSARCGRRIQDARYEELNIGSVDLAIGVCIAFTTGCKRAAVIDRTVGPIAAELVCRAARVAVHMPREVAGEGTLLQAAGTEDVTVESDVEVG